jgi:hypothetical protein
MVQANRKLERGMMVVDAHDETWQAMKITVVLAFCLAAIGVPATARPTFPAFQCGRITVQPSSEKYHLTSEQIRTRVESGGEFRTLYFKGMTDERLLDRHFRWASSKLF